MASQAARRARGMRTQNMPPMFVTLVVSKLSSWLKADAACRVGMDAMTRGEVRARRRERRGARAAQAVCRQETNWESGAWHALGARLKHVLHVCDFGRVETQRLVERRRGLPSQQKGIQSRGQRPGGGSAVEQRRRKRHAGGGSKHNWGSGEWLAWDQLWSGAWHAHAHVKHVAHVCDAGRVETQRLVERRRFLPRRMESIRSRVRW